MATEQPFCSTLDVTVEVFLRQIAVDVMAVAETISNAMICRADLLTSLFESERQETSSFPQSLNDNHFSATPAPRRDSGCTRSGNTGRDRRDDSSETDPRVYRRRNHLRPCLTCDEGHYEQAAGRIAKKIAGTPVPKVMEENCGGDSVDVSRGNSGAHLGAHRRPLSTRDGGEDQGCKDHSTGAGQNGTADHIVGPASSTDSG